LNWTDLWSRDKSIVNIMTKNKYEKHDFCGLKVATSHSSSDYITAIKCDQQFLITISLTLLLIFMLSFPSVDTSSLKTVWTEILLK